VFHAEPPTLGAPVTYSCGTSATDMALVDVSGDGRLDLITLHGGDPGSFHVAINNGDGGFGAYLPYDTKADPRALAIVDVDGDTRMDIAVVSPATGNLTIFRGMP